MFNKTRDRIEKFEETNETFRMVKQHLQDNKVFYMSAPAIFAVGFVGGKYHQQPIEITNQITPVINNIPVIVVEGSATS